MLRPRRKDFALRLRDGIEKHGREAWIDLTNIPPSSEWWKEICTNIEAADNFVFVVSPDSVSLESEETELSKTRYQQGSIRRVKRKKGPDFWVFRWLNTTADGSRK